MTFDQRRVNAETQRKKALVLMEMQKKLGERLRYYRLQKGLTQFQLAEMAESSEATIKRVESGQNALSIMLRHLLRLCRALDVNPETMIRGIHL